MQITEFGEKAVIIGERVVPAFNVQVDGFPRYESLLGVGHFFPIYFELPFETGVLWVVSQYGDTPPACHNYCMESYFDGDIVVDMYVDFANESDLVIRKIYKSWDELLDAYKKAIY